MFLVIIISIASSCKKETEEPIDFGLEYFPTKEGFYQIYKVDSIAYDDYTNTIDTFSFYVKMKIQESFLDNENNEAYSWHKYTKTDTTSWLFCDNNTITKTSMSLETVVDNIRLINLTFPVVAGNTWDLNAKNINDAVNSIFTDVDYSKSILGTNYNSCATASYEEEVNLIHEFIFNETYSKNIGMIHRKRVHKELKNNKIKGFDLEYNIIDYGNE